MQSTHSFLPLCVEKVQEGKYHVSGYPDIAPTEGAPENEDTMSFTATFEVFPDVEVPDMKDAFRYRIRMRTDRR